MTGSEAPLLDVSGVVKRYGGLVAIDHVDLELRAGTVTGVIGPNGAGKSTLIGLIGGAISPSEGSIRLNGRDISRLPASERARAGIGRTYQIPRPFLDMTVEENLEVAQYSIAPFIGATARENGACRPACSHRACRHGPGAGSRPAAAAAQAAGSRARIGAEATHRTAGRGRRRPCRQRNHRADRAHPFHC